MQFAQNKMEDCVATCRDVCARSTRHNSGNWPFLQTKAFYIISAVYRQAKEFDFAKEYMENSTEVFPSRKCYAIVASLITLKKITFFVSEPDLFEWRFIISQITNRSYTGAIS